LTAVSHRTPPGFAAIVVVLVLLVGTAVGAAPIRAQFQDGKLSLTARAAPVPDVLKAVADKTGVRFVVDSAIKPGPITIELEAMPLERAIRNLITAIPQAAGHTMTYARGDKGAPKLVQVSLFAKGQAPSGEATVYTASAEPPTPDLEERMDKMIQAGVPRETAEKVIGLTREVQKLQATPAPGSYRAEDLSPAMREQLQPLIDRGVPMERAVQMLLLQERYQETLKGLSTMQRTPLAMPPSSSR
jgi:hypothetical protein